MAGKTLSTRYVPAAITVPPFTTAAAPQTTSVDLGSVVLQQVEVLIALGHSWLTGLRVEYSGQALLPWSIPFDWIVGDGDRVPFEMDFDVSRPLTIRTFNTDVFQHVFRLRFKVSDPTPEIGPVAVSLVPITPLSVAS